MKTIRKDSYRGIPLGGWDEVEAAIRAFDSGRVPGARAAQQESLSGMDGMGAVMLLMNETLSERGAKNPFVERRVLSPLKAELKGKTSGSAEVDFDWDGPGVWHKTTLKVRKLNGRHFIEIWAAYVGDKPEENLAKVLGVERALIRSDVSAVFPVKTPIFTMDLDPVVDRVLVAFPEIAVLTGQQVQEGFAATKPGYYPFFQFFKNKDVSVTVAPDGCNRYKVLPLPGPGAKIQCEAHEDYGSEEKKGSVRSRMGS